MEVGRLTGRAEPMGVDLKSRAIDEELRKSHGPFSERPHLARVQRVNLQIVDEPQLPHPPLQHFPVPAFPPCHLKLEPHRLQLRPEQHQPVHDARSRGRESTEHSTTRRTNQRRSLGSPPAGARIRLCEAG
jgi:hypothetical protein